MILLDKGTVVISTFWRSETLTNVKHSLLMRCDAESAKAKRQAAEMVGSNTRHHPVRYQEREYTELGKSFSHIYQLVTSKVFKEPDATGA